jgi:SpoVK/Ycf46/Vps4 family AAA+-type ATPase
MMEFTLYAVSFKVSNLAGVGYDHISGRRKQMAQIRELEVERRVVSQLLTLMDSLKPQSNVVFISP